MTIKSYKKMCESHKPLTKELYDAIVSGGSGPSQDTYTKKEIDAFLNDTNKRIDLCVDGGEIVSKDDGVYIVLHTVGDDEILLKIA